MRYLFALVVLLSGCAVTPAVTSLGNDQYSAGSDSRALNAARSDAMKKATMFCSTSGKMANAETYSDQSGPNFYHSNVVFTCI
jgi:hypothetical protein